MEKTKAYLESLFAEIHKMELDQSSKLDTQFNVLSVMTTVFLGSSVAFFEKAPSLSRAPSIVIFYIAVVVFVAAILRVLKCLIMSYRGYKYAYIASPTDIMGYAKAIEGEYAHNEVEEDQSVDDRVSDEMHDYVADMLQRCGAENRQHNITRAAWSFRATFWLVAALVALIAGRGSMLFFVSEKPQRVVIGPTDKNDPIPVLIRGTDGVQKVEVTNRQKVEITNLPAVQKVSVTNPPAVQKVEVTGQLPPTKVEVINPKKEN